MTFRRVMLVVIPLLGAVFIYMVIRWLQADWEASLPERMPLAGEPSPTAPAGQAEMRIREFSHEVSTNVDWVRKDREGRIEMRFLADRLEHKIGKTADITRPRIQFFSRSGETITLQADQGRANTKGSLTNIGDIQTAVLWGNVVMIHDRGTPDDHSDDILVTMDDLKFTNESYELSTDGPIVLVGLDMQLTARKLQVALDRKTRRVNTMTFFEDIRITLEVGDRMKLGLLSPTENPPEAAAPAGKAPPAVGPKGPAAGPKAPAPAAPPPDERSDLWRIDLARNVDARQQDQHIACDRLVLYNRGSQAVTGPDAKGKTPDAGKGAGRAKEARPGRGKQEGDAAAAAKFLQPGAAAPLVVLAEGPMIITPVEPDERKTLGDQINQVVAKGAPVLVEDGQTRVTGDQVQYNTKTGSGCVIGKESPFLLEQPGRMRLTAAGRLDFDRAITPSHPYTTADVQGEGQLSAQVQTASLTGTGRPKPAADAKPAEPELSALDASWLRGMRLEFYRLPATTAEGGTGEIRKAVFHGQSVVKQRDGILKGDELAIDFFKPEPGRGQAVERLVGHGNVFIRNEPAEKKDGAKDAAKDGAKMAIGDITCQDIDMTFERAASGDTQPKALKATGAVEINDPSGKIKGEDLTVRFAPSAKGGGVEPQFFEAFRNVLVDREDLHAEGDHVRRDLAAGTILLEGRPARAARGKSRIVGPRIEFAQADGVAIVRGAGELEMPSSTDLRGQQRAQPEPLLVRWTNSMLFEDQRNFAQFDGAVAAATGTSRLNADRLWVYFADRPENAEAPPAKSPKSPAAAEKPAGPPAPAAKTAAKQPVPGESKPGKAAATAKTAPAEKAKAPDDGSQQLFGRKALTRVLAEKNVRAVEQQLLPDGTLRYQMEMTGENLTYVDENRKAYIRGPGRLRILSREKPAPGEADAGGLALAAIDMSPKTPLPDGYSRIDVAWGDSMAYDGASSRAYFRGDVDGTYAGRGNPGEGAARRARVTTTRVQSNDLQVLFGQKPPGDEPAVETREERMTLEKLAADGSVLLWVDDRRGSAERMIYQREPELMRLYRGPDDWARLWRENEASQEFDEIVARVITFQPSTGRVEVVEQQTMTLSPKVKPMVPPKKVAPPQR